jgi:anti-anti-sigma factor
VDIQASSTQSGITVVVPVGDIDMYSSAELKEAVGRHVADGAVKLVIDLAHVQYLDSSGVGVLLHIYTSFRKRKRHLLFSGLSGGVYRVLELTKLVGFLPVADTRDDAVRALEEIAAPTAIAEPRGILVDGASPLFRTDKMYHKEFYIDFFQIRRLSNLISRQAPPEIREINMLEQQISELIKNAVKHGNKNDKTKAVKIWFYFSATHAHLIVEDEGSGFHGIEEWNEFYRNKIECYKNQDYERMMSYLAFKTPDSDETDGGNALFAAVEYWNEGIVFNETRNAVAVRRRFGL